MHPHRDVPENSGPDANQEPRLGVLLAFLLIATLLPRALAFPINENLHGDAVVRTELAERWAEDPHWIRSFKDGAWQFGPLHLYVMGAVLSVWDNREDAGRLVSLVFGVISVLPLFFLTRRLFGWKAGLVAGLGFAAWGMHVQIATTAASEALSLFLVLMTLAAFARGWEEGTMRPLFYAAFFLNLACATRYDAWMLVPLLALLLAFGDRDRVAALTRAVIFTLACLPFAMFWMQGNEQDTGSPIYPVTYIQQFHDQWAANAIATYGELGFRAMNLFFWPAVALFTLTPLLGLFGIVGLGTTWRKHPEHRWLIWVIAVPTAYFTFRSAVLADFVPLGRFTVIQVALLLPFVAAGFTTVAKRVPPPVRHGLLGVTALLAVAMPVWLGLFTWQAEQGMAVTLNPVSPIATNPPAVMKAARYLKTHIAPGTGSVVIDADDKYQDVQLAFFSGLDESRLLRVRWDDFDQRYEAVRPEYLVRIEGGRLEQRPDFDVNAREGRVQLGEHWYEELSPLQLPFRIYRRVSGEPAPAGTNTAGRRYELGPEEVRRPAAPATSPRLPQMIPPPARAN